MANGAVSEVREALQWGSIPHPGGCRDQWWLAFLEGEDAREGTAREDSHRLGRIAQQAEHLAHNEKVVGSSPAPATKHNIPASGTKGLRNRSHPRHHSHAATHW